MAVKKHVYWLHLSLEKYNNPKHCTDVVIKFDNFICQLSKKVFAQYLFLNKFKREVFIISFQVLTVETLFEISPARGLDTGEDK